MIVAKFARTRFRKVLLVELCWIEPSSPTIGRRINEMGVVIPLDAVEVKLSFGTRFLRLAVIARRYATPGGISVRCVHGGSCWGQHASFR